MRDFIKVLEEIMKESEFDSRDLEISLEELENTRKSYKLTLVIGVSVTLAFLCYTSYAYDGEFDWRIFIMSFLLIGYIFFGGLWGLYRQSKRLEADIRKGVKVEGKSIIISYNKFKHNVKLEDGFRIESIDIDGSWKVGDLIFYSYLPKSKRIISASADYEVYVAYK